jgi:hypothetical protein
MFIEKIFKEILCQGLLANCLAVSGKNFHIEKITRRIVFKPCLASPLPFSPLHQIKSSHKESMISEKVF